MITTEQWLVEWAVTVLADRDSLARCGWPREETFTTIWFVFITISLDLLQIYSKFN